MIDNDKGYVFKNSDCLDFLATLPNNSVDLVLTDPPYNLGSDAKKRNYNFGNIRPNNLVDAGWDNYSEDDWLDLMNSFIQEVSRVLKPSGSFICFMASSRVSFLSRIGENNGLYYKTIGVWHKNNPVPRNKDLHFINSVELWLYMIKPDKTKRTGVFNNNGKAVHDFVETNSISSYSLERKHGKHPTQKPLALMDFFVNLLSNEGDVVLDPFTGSGSTAVSALRNKRKFIGCELSEQYFDLASCRIEDVPNSKNVLNTFL